MNCNYSMLFWLIQMRPVHFFDSPSWFQWYTSHDLCEIKKYIFWKSLIKRNHFFSLLSMGQCTDEAVPQLKLKFFGSVPYLFDTKCNQEITTAARRHMKNVTNMCVNDSCNMRFNVKMKAKMVMTCSASETISKRHLSALKMHLMWIEKQRKWNWLFQLNQLPISRSIVPRTEQ